MIWPYGMLAAHLAGCTVGHLRERKGGVIMAVERVTLNLPPELKYWLEKAVQQRKTQGQRTSLNALVIEILEKEARATSNYPVLE